MTSQIPVKRWHQLVAAPTIGLVVTGDGVPLGYEVFAGKPT